MLAVAASLALLAFALAWPVPVALARAGWPRRMPGAALVLWQAIALAGALSMIGALLVFGLIPFGDDLPHAAGSFASDVLAGRLPANANFFQMFALAGAVLLGVHLLLNLVRTTWRAERQRRHHVQLLRLLSDPMPERPGTRVIDHATPVAYCLPGAPRATMVLSAGLLELLSEDELAAVVAHERAHVTQHHHVLLVAFSAWRSALPWFPIATRAHEAVGLLIELLADLMDTGPVAADGLRERDAADEAVLTRLQAMQEIRNHQLSAEDFFADCGNQPLYRGRDLLNWLGY